MVVLEPPLLLGDVFFRLMKLCFFLAVFLGPEAVEAESLSCADDKVGILPISNENSSSQLIELDCLENPTFSRNWIAPRMADTIAPLLLIYLG